MDVQIEETSSTTRKLTITLPMEQVNQAFDKAYRKVSRSAKIPGFRPGKIPRNLIEIHYSPQVHEEVREELLVSTLANAFKDIGVSPINRPEIDFGELKRDQSFSYTAKIEIQPDIELKQYKELPVPTVSADVDETRIDTDLEKLRENAAQLVPVMLRDVVATGDIVQVDYKVTIGGVPVNIEHANGTNVLIEIGGEGYLEGLSDGLLGAKVPSEREIPVTFPEDYSEKELAGKQTTFLVKVKELKSKELPKLDDEFAQDLGAESLTELKQKLRDSVYARHEYEAKQKRKNYLMEALVKTNPFELSEALIKDQADRMIANSVMQVQQYTKEKIDLSADMLASLRKDSWQKAEAEVRAGILLMEVAKKEDLQIDEVALQKEIDRMLENAGTDEQRVRSQYSEPDARMQLRFRMLEEKVVDFLLENAKDTDPIVEDENKSADEMAEPALIKDSDENRGDT